MNGEKKDFGYQESFVEHTSFIFTLKMELYRECMLKYSNRVVWMTIAYMP